METASGPGRYSAGRVLLGGEACVRLTDAGAHVSAVLAPARGCDVVSLTHRGRELLHRGGDLSPPPPGAWGGHAPLLFPAVGRHRDGAYTAPDGVSRPMGTHGFGSQLAFEARDAGADVDAGASAVFSVAAGDAGAAAGAVAYPFPWRLVITATLRDGELRLAHAVHNAAPAGGPGFPIAIGNHISLAFPLVPSGVDGDAAAAWARGRVHGAATHECALTPGSLLSGATAPRPELASGAGLPLTDPLATNGVLADLSPAPAVPQWLRVAQPGALAVRVWQACSDARVPTRFVLWGAPPPATGGGGRGFVCPEPWLTVGPDSLNGAPGNGTPVLAPGESVTWTMGVAVEEGESVTTRASST